MDEMSHHNAALVQQTNAAIEQTEAQAVELDQIVDVFRVDRETQRSIVKPERGARTLQLNLRGERLPTPGNAALARD
ncbi:MAG: hypothetical protein EOQ80_16775 [Mesorhizobium sp.]|uniref:hypothetical protein n=1 Tax=Mesorhizobium sp. TaxID=1871066 RepID=UPI000FE8D54D|nr:hypothetical protein [Mesorhizobium sp.]RWH46680.1 MAG: hypothetical protein EOQ80_16775 [Mesorhizobium sp.]